MNVEKRRRLENKTDYRLRIELLKSGKPRIVFRKTNKYVIGQCLESENAQDKIITGLTSKELLKYGWPKENLGSLKSLPACYLTGFLLGKRILKKTAQECILDMGMLRNVKKSRIYAFLKGIVDSGVKINASKEIFPDEKRLKGEHTKVKHIFEKVKESIKNG